MKPIIRVENLSKQYRIGAKQASYATLRESLTDVVFTPFRQLKNLSNGSSEQSALATQNSNTIWALKDVSFDVMPGEVVGIIGRNGAGKSTLLKILSRITEPTSGKIDLYGRIGSLLEVGTGFHPELTGRENIYLNGAILGMSRTQIASQFDRIVDFAEVEKFLDTPVKHYSSGMYVRLAFAVAAHLEPEILLLDEVLAVGDAAFQKKCLERITGIAEEGRTVLLVSHNMGMIAQYCSRAILLRNGIVESDEVARDAISSYLSDQCTDSASWERPHPYSGDAEAALTSACIKQDGQESGTVRFDSSFFIEVRYTVNKPLRDIMIMVRLMDAFGSIVFDSLDTDHQEWAGIVRQAGKYVSACRVPRYLIKPGKYTVSVGSYISGIKMIEFYDGIISIEMSEIGYPLNSGRSGCITPVLDWQVGMITEPENDGNHWRLKKQNVVA
jgi:lipopolysaccharide transport system ATP-binding protein